MPRDRIRASRIFLRRRRRRRRTRIDKQIGSDDVEPQVRTRKRGNNVIL